MIWSKVRKWRTGSFWVEMAMDPGDERMLFRKWELFQMLGVLAGQMLLTCGHTPTRRQEEFSNRHGKPREENLMLLVVCWKADYGQWFFCTGCPLRESLFAPTSLETWSGCRRAPETREAMPYGKRLSLTCVALQKEQQELTWLIPSYLHREQEDHLQGIS